MSVCVHCQDNGVAVCTEVECSAADPRADWVPSMCRPCWVRLRHAAGMSVAPGDSARLVPPPCRHLGGPTGEMVACQSCRGRVELKLFACAVHGRCTPTKPAPDVACCAGCSDASPRLVVQVVCEGDGIGDHLVALTVCAGLKHSRPDAHVVLGCRQPGRAQWVRLFDGCDQAVYPALPPAGAPGGVESYRTHDHPRGNPAGPRGRWEEYADSSGATPVLPEPRPLPAEVVRWAEPYRGAVALAPWSDWAARTYPLRRWLELEKLLLECGHRTVILDHRPGRNDPFSGDKVIGEPPVRVAAVLAGARVLVSNDSGLAHVAGILRAPVLALCGIARGAVVYGLYPTVRWLDGLGGRVATIAPAEVVAAAAPYLRDPWDGLTLMGRDKLDALRRSVRETSHLDGDLAELGVYRGGSVLAMSDAVPGKTLHLFDTFAGLPCDDPEGKHRCGEMVCSLTEVRTLLAGRDVVFHRGVFPATTLGLEHLRFACVHVDADLYESTRDAISYFWPRLVPGGCLVLDDWEWPDTPGVTRAIREAFAPAQIEVTSPNQCRVRKPLC